MEVTEVRVFLKESPDKKLRAYATVTFDSAFVVRNIKVIDGTNGLFIAMPSRKVKSPCPKCGFRNESRGKYCTQCAARLPAVVRPVSTEVDPDGSHSDHRDIAHPITQHFRDYLQKKILEAYVAEKSQGPSAVNREYED